jgi:hypothetical protein
MTKLIKTSGEVQTHDFSKALGEAFERVEKCPKKKKRKKKANIARRVAAEDILIAGPAVTRRAIAQRFVNNPAFDPLVVSGRTSMREPNIANPPRSGEMRGLASELVGALFDDGMVNYPMSTAIENLENALAERKVASPGTATSMFVGDDFFGESLRKK